MPNLPISALPAATALDGSELFAAVQSGVTTYTTGNSIIYIPTNNYGLFSQTGSSVPVYGSAASVATSGSLLDGGVGTLSVPANGFRKGDTFNARLSGKINIANNHTLEVHFKSDSVNLVDTGVITMAASTNKNWILDVTFVIREIGGAGTASILSSGELTVRTDASNDVVTEIFSSVNNTTFDTTINNTLYIEGILGAACIASENIYSEMFTLNKVY